MTTRENIMRKSVIVLATLLFAFVHAAKAADAPAMLSYKEIKVQIARVEIRPGVSTDDAVEPLKLRANQLYKEIEALTGKPSRRIEIFNFCDGLTAQKMIAADPLMISFMPCRIAIVEDMQGKRWVISMMISADMIRT